MNSRPRFNKASGIAGYREIYRFDLGKGEVYLIAIGHRREIYRDL